MLDIDVDLKIVTNNFTIELRRNIFEGKVMYELFTQNEEVFVSIRNSCNNTK